jgi:hypothetical protein
VNVDALRQLKSVLFELGTVAIAIVLLVQWYHGHFGETL